MGCEGPRRGAADRGAAAAVAPGLLFALIMIVTTVAGCGERLDVGSDLAWTARFETGDFSEWTDVAGAAQAFPQPNTIEVSGERAHHGDHAAKLTITAGVDGAQANAGLSRAVGLPTAGYYSAWYYLPVSVTVGDFWVIFKFRLRAVADDASTAAELYDLNLTNLASGEMSLRLFDHRAGDVPLLAPAPVVPVGEWFQVEAFYRNAPDATGRLTLWLNGKLIVDVTGKAMSSNAWVAWDVCSDAVDLTPATAVLYADDCALSGSRVGPAGRLETP